MINTKVVFLKFANEQFFFLTFFPYLVYFGGKIEFFIFMKTFLISKQTIELQ